MEEEVGIKVTRLRRRLSVEADDVKSPSTQSTPTKKRGGRLAAKPQLELIDENSTETEKSKKTRKSTVKDVEPEEKPATPSRRSTRIKSNTSIVSETTADAEDKGTPSRRSTRIKSNTSLVAETLQFTDSPRAKRAARRTSQIGSDSETPITPARQTRRTRKDSTSSIDKQVEPVNKLAQVKDVIVEESENNVKDTTNNNTPTKERTESPSVRKSPRLIEKTGEKTSPDLENKENEPESSQKIITINKSDSTIGSGAVSSSTNVDQNIEIMEENNLSVSSDNLIKELESEPKKHKLDLNKTSSEADLPQAKSKRHRTKSWTTISSSPAKDQDFLSDTEAIKKKNRSLNLSESGSGDGLLNESKKSDQENENHLIIEEVQFNSSTMSEKKKRKYKNQSIAEDKENSIINSPTKLNSSKIDEKDSSINISKTNLNSSQNVGPSFTEKFFSMSPTGAVQSIVYIDDSDSNTETIEKVNVNKELETEDQCVPVVEHHLENENCKESKNNLSYEPMDIDETLPENTSLAGKNTSARLEGKDTGIETSNSMFNISKVNNVSINNSSKEYHRKSTVIDLEEDNDTTLNKQKTKSGIANTSVNNNDESKNNEHKNLNKSKRKSSITNTTAENIDSKPENIENNDTNNSFSKSKRKSSVTAEPDESIVKDNNTNKSKRKSSISNIEADDQLDKNSTISDTVNDVVINTGLNKSHRKSSISTIDNNKKPHNYSENSQRDTSNSNMIDNDEVDNQTKRKSSIENIDVEINNSSNKNKRKSSITSIDNNTSTLRDSGKSERKSSIANKVDEVDSSPIKKILIENSDGNMNKTSYKSKRKSSISKTMSDDNADSTSDKSKIKSDNANEDYDKRINKNSNKSKRKSSISNANIDNNMDNSVKSKKSSVTHMESQSLDKSGNASKSTLVLSQLKDISETNVHKYNDEFNELNDSNEQLSKSVVSKIDDKKNISSTYSTSTPLHQKSMKKIGLQINTSIITPNSVSKTENKGSLNNSKKAVSILSQNDEESEEESEDSNEEECSEIEEDSEEDNNLKDKSKMIDDEAEEASDDYESGDSRNDDEKEYEEQNEIVDRGETLDSEDEDFSDDSNYEKGSFIVDSDEEDDELLSGSGDDLSMSAEELTMSAKSKNKFNERKIKEQKEASREMYESRHKVNKSDKGVKSDKPKSKKSNRQRLDSSTDGSDENVDIKPKKHRRARIDSSQDLSISRSDAEKSATKKKNKVKRLSESACEENATKEKEISFQENNETNTIDPLSLQNIVKVEPKTPQKDLNVSTVAITNLEEVQIDENVSIMKINQTSDPLQSTVAQDDSMDDDSDASISEDEEITHNYESMLKDLNKKSMKVKSLNISLNLHKKAKEKTKEPIVDQLNLTQVKKTKKRTIKTSEISGHKQSDDDESKSSKTLKTAINNQDEGSSDSIDMKLLFDEDSTDNENKGIKGLENSVKEDVEYFIPLKRTEAKTNILESSDVTHTAKDDSVLNVSKSKKNKRKSSQSEEISGKNEQENEDIGFFIDTTGTHTDMNQSVGTNTSMKDKTKKNKQKNNVSFANTEETNDGDSNDAPLEVSYQSDKKNKSKQDLNTTQTDITSTSIETPNQSGKKKKKNKQGLDSSQIITEGSPAENTDDKAEKSMNTSTLSVTGSKKKKKKLSESHADLGTENEVETESAKNISIGSAKNKKSKTVSETSIVDNIIEDDENIEDEHKNTKKRKRKPSANPSMEEIEVKDVPNLLNTSKKLNESVITNEKKKRKILHVEEARAAGDISETESQDRELFKSSGMKGKKKNALIVNQKSENNNNEPMQKSKKRKQRDDDDDDKLPKIIKQNTSDKVHVPRLPASVIKQLDDNPNVDVVRKVNVVSTTSFKVEETKKRRNKPSQYLEQSVYLNDSVEEKTKKSLLKKPKVLPFIPTASTSDHGFTTKFRINVIPQDTQFVAQSTDMTNFKKDYLHNNRIKKLGTFEKYKRHRNIKISKF